MSDALVEAGLEQGNKVDLRWVDVNSIEPNNYNPNKMDERTFDELVKDIEQEELDQPIVVVPNPEKEGSFIIVDGEHRWRASKMKGLKEVPISVRNYTEEEAMIKTVRRNMIHGSLDKGKFNAMLRKLDDKGITPEKARELMAMDPRNFQKMFVGQSQQTAQKATELMEKASEGVKATQTVANLSQMIRELVLEYGDTLNEGYVAFMFKEKPCLMISMDAKLQKLVVEYVQTAREDGKDQKAISSDLQGAFRALLGVE